MENIPNKKLANYLNNELSKFPNEPNYKKIKNKIIKNSIKKYKFYLRQKCSEIDAVKKVIFFNETKRFDFNVYYLKNNLGFIYKIINLLKPFAFFIPVCIATNLTIALKSLSLNLDLNKVLLINVAIFIITTLVKYLLFRKKVNIIVLIIFAVATGFLIYMKDYIASISIATMYFIAEIIIPIFYKIFDIDPHLEYDENNLEHKHLVEKYIKNGND